MTNELAKAVYLQAGFQKWMALMVRANLIVTSKFGDSRHRSEFLAEGGGK